MPLSRKNKEIFFAFVTTFKPDPPSQSAMAGESREDD